MRLAVGTAGDDLVGSLSTSRYPVSLVLWCARLLDGDPDNEVSS